MDGMEQRGKDYEMEQDGGPPDGDIGPGVIMKELDIKDADPWGIEAVVAAKS